MNTEKHRARIKPIQKSSSNDGTHPYLLGFNFWKKNQFWNTNSITEKGREYFNDSLNRMQSDDRVLSRIDEQMI